MSDHDESRDALCHICKKGEDESSPGSHWTACEGCQLWHHNACVGLREEKTRHWRCLLCTSLPVTTESENLENTVIRDPLTDVLNSVPLSIDSSVYDEGAGTSHAAFNLISTPLSRRQSKEKQKVLPVVIKSGVHQPPAPDQDPDNELEQKLQEATTRLAELKERQRKHNERQRLLEEINREIAALEMAEREREREYDRRNATFVNNSPASGDPQLMRNQSTPPSGSQRLPASGDPQSMSNQSMLPSGSQLPPTSGVPQLGNQSMLQNGGQLLPASGVPSLLEQQARLVNRQLMAELPEFAGDSEQFPTWYATFEDSTREAQFNAAENMNRLRKCLRGRAFDAVRDALALPNNVDSVIKILKTRFGDMTVIVQTRIQKLDYITPPNEGKPETVVNFYEFLLNLRSTLACANATNYLNAPQLLDSIIRKLPTAIQIRWTAHKMRSHQVNLDSFLEWYAPTYQNASVQLETMNASKTPARRERVSYHEEQSSKSRNICSYCRRDNHVITECKKFAGQDLKRRWDFIRKGQWCFKCLKEKHFTKDCKSKKACNVDQCEENHHRLLHKTKVETNKSDKQEAQPTQVVNMHQASNTTMYKLVPVFLSNGDRQVSTWAFLDDGSGPTLVSQKMADQLKLGGRKNELCLKWTNRALQKIESLVTTVNIKGIKERKLFTLNRVQTVPELDLPMPKLDLKELKRRYAHLRNVDFPEVPMAKPEILIGLEHAKVTLTYQYREGSWDEPLAAKTRLGWAIYGKAADDESRFQYSCHVCECMDEEKVVDLIKKFQTTEAFGTQVITQPLRSREDEIAIEIFEKTLKFAEGHYEVGLLWKNPNATLPDNSEAAFRRLICFEQKLMKDELLRERVREKVRDCIEKKYWIPTSQSEVDSHAGRKWFLPVFAVQNPNKPTKIRLVYDAAARCQGTSLNDKLIAGPDNLKSLFGVLLRFRRGLIAFCGDIREMYHQIMIRPEDQFSQLIMWRDLNTDIPPTLYKLRVMSFGATCSPSTAQYVKNYHAEKYKTTHQEAVRAIQENTYVDDCLDCADSVEDAKRIIDDIISINASGGMEIRNWFSNSKELNRQINKEKCSTVDVSLDMGDSATEKVLGLYWNTNEDCFTFSTNFSRIDPDIITLKRPPTKREVLRIVMSIFDPFGMLSPVILPCKILIQDLWKIGIKWDQHIPTEVQGAWKSWLTAINTVQQIKIPRPFFPRLNIASEIEFHAFSDASELAFAAVVYMRWVKDDRINLSFIAAKTRVAPQKPISIPRLELQGAVLAVRLAKNIRMELNLEAARMTYWTDSQTVLGWIRSYHRKYHTFVAHRVGEILDATNQPEWRWVPGKVNVADDGTKWHGEPKISSDWFDGPMFLARNSDEWPVEKNKITTTDEEESIVQYHAAQIQENTFPSVEVNRFSKWNRLHRAIAYMVRYKNVLYSRCRSRNKKQLKLLKTGEISRAIINSMALTSTELEMAKIALIHKMQCECFSLELAELSREKCVSRSSPIFQLNPMLNEHGLICLENRLDSAPAEIINTMKRPVLLDGKHNITKLIIQSLHENLYHCNRETVVNELRQQYWVPHIRACVKKVVNECNMCRKFRAKPKIPRMANLPQQRTDPFNPPFTYTGVDYAGPFLVKIGRRHEKRWIVVFTCITTRALHLEVASTLNTSSCVMALRNFMSRRGVPREIMSDNGTNLKATEKELKDLLTTIDKKKLIEESQPNIATVPAVKWSFIPPAAPHFGGIWERVVRSVKDVLYRILTEQIPPDEVFRSAVIEVEGIINSRPLYYTSSDDINQPAITPNSLLQLTLETPTVKPADQLKSRQLWTQAQEIVQNFWQRWLKEYLPTIANRTKWYDEKNPLEIGALVLVIDEMQKRGDWKLGVVEAVRRSQDGRIRAATVRTARGSFLRPVSKLAVIRNCNAESV